VQLRGVCSKAIKGPELYSIVSQNIRGCVINQVKEHARRLEIKPE
jgi:hypothetical protein